ncbi:hypothetical protein AB1Y20_020105 [Prymnesium parvum]|uniref:Carboxypeptidase n=1 Tax=Prymnesium parvum TaxID=97485 RepID=A0AB34JW57_PRYPA
MKVTKVGMTLLISLACLHGLHEVEPTDDEVKALPGWDAPLPSRQWSGYLSVGEHKHLHYWLVEAENDPASAPLVLWLNGGPGCSSLDGFIYEHGPFRTNPMDPTKLVRFEHTWASVANMLYLEAPAGVGFSYSTNPADYQTNDDQTAQDSADALNAFFGLFPRFVERAFFLTGESYAGVYVPTLAEAILSLTEKGEWKGPKLHGIAVGNGCSGTEVGVCGGQRWIYDTQYLLGSAFVQPLLKKQISTTCNFSASAPSAACRALLDQMSTEVGQVNLYNVYGECINGQAQANTATHKIPYAANFLGSPRVGGPVACIDSIAGSAYFNQPAVLAAAHVKKPPYEWSTCGNQVEYTPTRKNLPRDTYPALVRSLRVVVYNGDWDACVPHTDGEAWTSGMGYDKTAPWHPWLYKNGTQVAGYAVRYAADNFTFITVKGGRHEVPETAPAQALEMIRRLVSGELF